MSLKPRLYDKYSQNYDGLNTLSIMLFIPLLKILMSSYEMRYDFNTPPHMKIVCVGGTASIL